MRDCHFQSKALVSDLLKANKIVKHVKSTQNKVKFIKLNVSSIRLGVYCDARYANLRDGGSQAGYMIFLYDESFSCCPIAWSSKRIKRVVRSTLAAETLAAIESLDSAFLVSNIISEIIFGEKGAKIEMQLFPDNKSQYDAVHTTNVINEKRLKVDISALREMIERDEFEIHWIQSNQQLADVFTKKVLPKLY